MSDWNSGYVTEIDYTHGYYPELNPLRARLALLYAGYAFPKVENACEMAFGQGVSVNIHAAAHSAQWFGNDFNPAQAAFARDMAAHAGSGAQLTDESFAELSARDDLPQFDFIGLHGIFSWVTADNQAHIENFIQRRLKMGGVLYISYNTFPGWTAMMPMQHLLSQHAQVMGVEGAGVIQRLESSMQFVDRVLATQPLSARANPTMAERFKRLKGQDRSYLAHEYLNRNWQPLFFTDMARRLQGAKLNYACSAIFTDSMNEINLTKEQATLVGEIRDPVFREMVRDFIINQQFRRDYWVKGARRLTSLEQLDTVKSQRFVQSMHRSEVTPKISGALGEATISERTYEPLLDVLGDGKPHTAAELLAGAAKQGLSQNSVFQSLQILLAKGAVQMAQDDAAISAANVKTRRLNSYLIERSRSRVEVQALASPVTAGGIHVNRVTQLFLSGLDKGRAQAPELAQYVWDIFASQGQRLISEGKPVEKPEDNQRMLNEMAEKFLRDQLPVLKGLHIA